MPFIQLGQQWASYTRDKRRSPPVRLRPGQWCWSERVQGESGLCPVGEVVTIEDAIQLEDAEGNDIPGGLERAELWDTIATRRKLPIPKQRVRRKPKKSRKTSSKSSTQAA